MYLDIFISDYRGPVLWTISLSIYERVRNAVFHPKPYEEYNLIRIYNIQGKEEMVVSPFIARNSNLEDLRLAGTVDVGETSTSVLSRI